jgi:hypothetical protein
MVAGTTSFPHDEIDSRPLFAGPRAKTTTSGRVYPLAAAALCR